MRMTDDNLRGRTIIAADGQVVGEIAGFYLDSASLRVESLQVKLRKEAADLLGTHRGLFHAPSVEIPTKMLQSVGQTVVLAVPLDALRPLLTTSENDAAASP